MSTNKPDTLPTGSDALAVISQLRRGQTALDLAEGLAELVAAVRATGKKGALTLKLTLAPHAKGDDVILTLSDDVTLTDVLNCRIVLKRFEPAFAKALDGWKISAADADQLIWTGEIAGPDRLRFLGILSRYTALVADLSLTEN